MDIKYFNRTKDSPWFEKSQNEEILLVGCGGIGSNALYFLTKSIPAIYNIIDKDIVESHNIGSQFFKKDQLGKYKVESIKTNCELGYIRTFKQSYSSEFCSPITITALDNMETRKLVYQAWKVQNSRELLIDGRLRATLYEIYIVTPGKEEEYEKTLFDDKEVDEGPCTFKQTAFFAGLIGARITQVVANYLTNKYSSEPICSIPFSIKEVGEPFYIEIK